MCLVPNWSSQWKCYGVKEEWETVEKSRSTSHRSDWMTRQIWLEKEERQSGEELRRKMGRCENALGQGWGAGIPNIWSTELAERSHVSHDVLDSPGVWSSVLCHSLSQHVGCCHALHTPLRCSPAIPSLMLTLLEPQCWAVPHSHL